VSGVVARVTFPSAGALSATVPSMRVVRALGRFFSGRRKSPLRNATETAILFAALVLIIFGLRGEPMWRLTFGTLAVAACGFVIGFGFTVFDNRRHPG